MVKKARKGLVLLHCERSLLRRCELGESAQLFLTWYVREHAGQVRAPANPSQVHSDLSLNGFSHQHVGSTWAHGAGPVHDATHAALDADHEDDRVICVE